MQTFARDLQYAIRTLIKNRGFTVVALVALALGIGANTVIFSIVNAVLIRSLPYPDPDRLVLLFESSPQDNSFEQAVSPANYLDWKTRSSSFDGLAIYREDSFILTGGDRPERVAGTVATPDLFPVLGVRPALGQQFRTDDLAANLNSIVISYSFWTRHFGSDPNVIGQKLNLGGEPYSVVGVMPADFSYPEGVELWITPRFAAPEHPLRPGQDPARVRGSEYLDVIGRLKSGVKLEQARADMQSIGNQLAEEYPDNNKERSVSVFRLREETVGDIRTTLLILFGAVAFVLLIACANVANLLMARAANRRKEIAIRAALGASRWRIARQLLTESVVLALAGGGLGLGLAVWGIRPLVSLMPAGIHGANLIGIDPGVLLFTVSVSIVTGVLFGLLPALQATKTDLNEALKEGGRSGSGGSAHNRIRSLLVVAEISLSLILLVGAGLLIKSFIRVQSVDPGFETSNLMTMRINLPNTRYHTPREQSDFFERVVQKIRLSPEVESAAAVSRFPLTPGNSGRSLTIEGRSPDDNPSADYRVVTVDYFKTMGIPLVRGREFTEGDDASAPPVGIINELAARRIWPDEDPIGRRFRMEDDVWVEIVGIVGNIKHFGLDTKSNPEVYLPCLKKPWPFMAVVVRAHNGTGGLANIMRDALWSVDKDQPVTSLSTIEDLISRSMKSRRFNVLLLGIFAAIALSLAAVGTYGVIAYSVAQRQQEIGIRMALGASRLRVLKMILAQGMKVTGIGVLIGLGGAFALTRLIASLLFEVSTTDPLIFLGIALFLGVVAAFACYVPALTATRVDPTVALRAE